MQSFEDASQFLYQDYIDFLMGFCRTKHTEEIQQNKKKKKTKNL